MKMTEYEVPLAEALRTLIEFRHLTHVPLTTQAHAAGIDPQTLRRLTNGEMDDPQLRTVQALCRFYRISLVYFGLRTRQQVDDYLTQLRAREAADLVLQVESSLSQLSPRGQHNLQAMLERMELGDSNQAWPETG